MFNSRSARKRAGAVDEGPTSIKQVIFPWYNQALKKLLKPVMGGVSGIKKRSFDSC